VSIFDRIVEYSNISKPSERVPKEDGGMLVQPSDDGSRPEYGYAEENINLGQEEFAKKLNDRGFTTIQGDSFTRSNVNNIDNEIGIRKIQSYTLKQQKDFLKNTLRGGEELRDINKLSISAQEKESIIRKLANAIRSQDTRNSELGSFAHTDSREAKLWKNFFRASEGIDLKWEEFLKVKIYHKEKIGLEMQMEM
jgi:hypothetical protein